MVSGHTDIDPAIFETHYHALLDSALARVDRFIMGDAAGADTFARLYLTSPSNLKLYPDVKSRITIYPSRRAQADRLQQEAFQIIRPDNVPSASQPPPTLQAASANTASGATQGQKQVPSSTNGLYTTVVVAKKGRDASMTAASDYDILCARSEAESRELYGPKYRPRVSATEMNRMRRAELQAAGKLRVQQQQEEE